MKRRDFLKSCFAVGVAGPLAGCKCQPLTQTHTHPNIVWFVLEDITPMMGCYGDQYARTPVFDKLASEGIRYNKAYAVAPVCSPSRCGHITGMYPTSLGTIHHRSHQQGPDFLKMIPTIMRQAGYYTCNNAKMDYNLSTNPWDQCSRKAHWRNRPDKDQPFLAKFDLSECHSSITKIPEDRIVKERLNRLKPQDFHDPAKAPIPPFHPDVPEFRKAWSRYYDAVTQVDYRVGEMIQQLKEDGLWEDTIVIVWADHGVGMPRGKHTAWEQGTHVPLIMRFPEKYKHLAPAKTGSVEDDLISLIDIGPSTLALAGIETPDFMDGRPLLCKGKAKKREYVFAARGRLDSRSEMVRTVRDQRYRYHRNFFPHLPYKPYEDYEFEASILKKWVELARQGKLTGAMEMPAMRFKPVEELYDSKSDPFMANNVADDPKYTKVLKRMRKELHNWMIETRDLGILDEIELIERSERGKSQWDVGHQIDNYKEILRTADLMYLGKTAIDELLASAKNPDAAIRYWAVLGLAVIRFDDAQVVEGLQAALKDQSVSVRLAAVEGLFDLNRYQDGLPVLMKALISHPSLYVQVRAACILDSQSPKAYEYIKPAVEKMLIAYDPKVFTWEGDNKYMPAIEILKQKAENTKFKQMPGIPFGGNNPFNRAFKAITGQENYYRWGKGASGSPKSP